MSIRKNGLAKSNPSYNYICLCLLVLVHSKVKGEDPITKPCHDLITCYTEREIGQDHSDLSSINTNLLHNHHLT